MHTLVKYSLIILAYCLSSCDFESVESIKENSKKKPTAAKKKIKKQQIEGNILTTYYSNGKLASKKHFKYKTYQGDTTKHILNHGIIKHWYRNGKLKSELEYKEGRRHGKAKMYYDDGPLRLVENYVDGRLEGEKTRYTKHGLPMIITSFSNNIPIKTSQLFDLEGKELKKPKLQFDIIDDRLKNNKLIVNVSVKDLKNLRKADFSILTKNYKGEKMELKVKVVRGVGSFVLNVPPTILYVNKIQVNAKYLLGNGLVGSIVDSYNCVKQPLF
jgi:hypothetical protein